MLKALELSGFKSFADRTRFEFPPGITVIVGPNGSGKSNVVDAMKWVLGSQSAKSLRGNEMADVIFKGSSAGRKPLNTADVSIIFDNSLGQLPMEEGEVRVTRRVYRSGEGEYLINGQPCRLRDIKDLFRGTGVGSDAYSLIEQGKVSAMLQASPKDRRAIFEEAAGISRFKAKKIETERRLARVEQNLLRLSDIVDEVESRLRSVRSQASKARRYKEHSDRLQQLRTHVGLTDWRHMTQQLDALSSQLNEIRGQIEQINAQAASAEDEIEQLDAQMSDVSRRTHDVEANIAENREQLAARQASIDHGNSRCYDLEQEQRRLRSQLVAMNRRTGNLQRELYQTAQAAEEAELQYANRRTQLNQRQSELDQYAQKIDEVREQLKSRRDRRVDQMRISAELVNEIGAANSQVLTATATSQRCQRQVKELTEECDAHAIELESLESQQRSLAANVDGQKLQIEAAQKDLDRSRKRLEQRRTQLHELEARHMRSSERIAVLTELEERREGVDSGVKEILARAQQPNPGPFAHVCGMLAELIQVEVESASIVEAALGELVQAVVVDGESLFEHLAESEERVAGRVKLIPLENGPHFFEGNWPALAQQPGVIGRADHLVRTDGKFAPLIRRLLGNTWAVETLQHGKQLAKLSGEQLRFVTLDGSVLEADSTLTLNAPGRTSGLISRRSELRNLQRDLECLGEEISQTQQLISVQETEVREEEDHIGRLKQLHRELEGELTEHRAMVHAARQHHARMEKQLSVVQAEYSAANVQRRSADQQLADAQRRLAATEDEIAANDEEIRQASVQLETFEAQQKACGLLVTTAKVEVAKSEERLVGLKARREQLQRDHDERHKAVAEVGRQVDDCSRRVIETERIVLNDSAALALLALDRESFARSIDNLIRQRHVLSRQHGQLSQQLNRCRQEVRAAEDKQHQLEMSAGQLRNERSHLAERMKEDYGIDLASASGAAADEEEEHQREAVEDEIADLRRKINSIGAVNLDALEELEQLEERFNSLSGQYNDLQDAKSALEKIIARINTDSRHLFADTLEVIRANFQALYRKLFGGGHADIVLEENVDILEAGIEIVANPPGKPAFSNSLLSGGEQGLTAVALLLALFQHRPSPFCVLDEVDAPLDESNIGRFVDVLRDFLESTRFIIVTHSKKTMTAANTLYGVTMQEPNVSKRVSVKFEDVSEDGHIHAHAVGRSEVEEDDDERGAA